MLSSSSPEYQRLLPCPATCHMMGGVSLQKLLLWTCKILLSRSYPDGPGVKNPPCNAGDSGLIPDWGTKIPHDALTPCPIIHWCLCLCLQAGQLQGLQAGRVPPNTGTCTSSGKGFAVLRCNSETRRQSRCHSDCPAKKGVAWVSGLDLPQHKSSSAWGAEVSLQSYSQAAWSSSNCSCEPKNS